MVTQQVSKPTHNCGGTLEFVLTVGGRTKFLQNLQTGTDDNGAVSDHYSIIADLTTEANKISTAYTSANAKKLLLIQ